MNNLISNKNFCHCCGYTPYRYYRIYNWLLDACWNNLHHSHIKILSSSVAHIVSMHSNCFRGVWEAKKDRGMGFSMVSVCEKWGKSQNKKEGGEGRKEGSFLPFPPPRLFRFFGSRTIFRAGKIPKILFQGLSLLPNPTEMQAIKLWSECSEFYDYVLHVFYLLQLVLVVELLDLPFWKLCCRVW